MCAYAFFSELICMSVWHPCVAVMINGGVDPFHRWGGWGGLWKDCLIVCPAESNTCRLTQLALQMDHLWRPTLTSLRGERLLDQGSWLSHVLSQVTWDMLLNNNGVFAALLRPCWANVLCTQSWRDTRHMKPLLTAHLSKLMFSTVSLKWSGRVRCILCWPLPILAYYWFPLCVTGPGPGEQSGDIF